MFFEVKTRWYLANLMILIARFPAIVEATLMLKAHAQNFDEVLKENHQTQKINKECNQRRWKMEDDASRQTNKEFLLNSARVTKYRPLI